MPSLPDVLARRSQLVIAVTCVVGGIAGFVLTRVDASETVFLLVAATITAAGTVVAVAGAPRDRRPPRSDC